MPQLVHREPREGQLKGDDNSQPQGKVRGAWRLHQTLSWRDRSPVTAISRAPFLFTHVIHTSRHRTRFLKKTPQSVWRPEEVITSYRLPTCTAKARYLPEPPSLNSVIWILLKSKKHETFHFFHKWKTHAPDPLLYCCPLSEGLNVSWDRAWAMVWRFGSLRHGQLKQMDYHDLSRCEQRHQVWDRILGH